MKRCDFEHSPVYVLEPYENNPGEQLCKTDQATQRGRKMHLFVNTFKNNNYGNYNCSCYGEREVYYPRSFHKLRKKLLLSYAISSIVRYHQRIRT